MKKIIIFILAASLLLSSLGVSAYADEANGGYDITPRDDRPPLNGVKN